MPLFCMNPSHENDLIHEAMHNSSITVTNVRLAARSPDVAEKLWRVECRAGKVLKVAQLPEPEVPRNNHTVIDAKGSLMLPSLCHSHIHLDKCFILDKCGDLVKGNFDEAMKLTAKAKASFPKDEGDLYMRASRLIRESVECGVTSMRAHVEVDTIVGFSCLNVALRVRQEWGSICDVHICVFAQEPLFQSLHATEPGPNYGLLYEAVQRREVSAVGSAPYVEPTIEQQKHNIDLILKLAKMWHLHADFHLDYTLDIKTQPMIYQVIQQMKADSTGYWTTTLRGPRVTIGHATRLQLLSQIQWRDLVKAMDGLPISIVGLPQSDMYMMGRADDAKPLGAPRSTLRVPHLAHNYGLQIAMSVNNIENAFTPQGSLDPLSLCTFGAAVFQAATPEDLRVLVRSVTTTSKLAIGDTEAHSSLFPAQGDPADFVILFGTKNLRSAVLNPSYDRTTIHRGQIVSRRRALTWTKMPFKPTRKIFVSWQDRVKWRYMLFPPYFLWKWIRGEAMIPLQVVGPFPNASELDQDYY